MNTNWIATLADDKDIQKQIEALALTTGKPEKRVFKEVVEAGLKIYKPMPSKSAQAILDLIAWAEKEHITGPKDLSTNHNTYAWEE